jgi:DNA-directed RNA polymerase specialized sigma24 family protein
MEESDLLAEQLRNGDKSALKALHDMYAGSTYTLAEKQLNGNTDIAEEVTAKVFVALWEARDRMENIQTVKSFLYICTLAFCREKSKKKLEDK